MAFALSGPMERERDSAGATSEELRESPSAPAPTASMRTAMGPVMRPAMRSGMGPVMRPVMGPVMRSVFVEQAAVMLGVSRRTVYTRIREGRLRTIRTACGSQRVLTESIEALRRGPTGEA